MNLPRYCKTCDAITGHEIHTIKSVCIKCGTVQRTPIITWILASIITIEVTILLVWFIVKCIWFLTHLS